MMSREQANASVREARERFRARVRPLPKWMRRGVARATRELAATFALIDLSTMRALEQLAELVDVEMTAGPPMPTSRPPDHEGDEELLAARGHARAGWRSA